MNCHTHYFIWKKYAYFCDILIKIKLYTQNVQPKNPFGCSESVGWLPKKLNKLFVVVSKIKATYFSWECVTILWHNIYDMIYDIMIWYDMIWYMIYYMLLI